MLDTWCILLEVHSLSWSIRLHSIKLKPQYLYNIVILLHSKYQNMYLPSISKASYLIFYQMKIAVLCISPELCVLSLYMWHSLALKRSCCAKLRCANLDMNDVTTPKISNATLGPSSKKAVSTSSSTFLFKKGVFELTLSASWRGLTVWRF